MGSIGAPRIVVEKVESCIKTRLCQPKVEILVLFKFPSSLPRLQRGDTGMVGGGDGPVDPSRGSEPGELENRVGKDRWVKPKKGIDSKSW